MNNQYFNFHSSSPFQDVRNLCINNHLWSGISNTKSKHKNTITMQPLYPLTLTLIPNPLALVHTLSLTLMGNFLPFNL